MFRDRAFTIALLISFTWHLTCIAAVNIVILPGKFKAREVASISFLGPILARDTVSANKAVAVIPKHEEDLQSMPRAYDIKKDTLSSAGAADKDINKLTENKIDRALNTQFLEVKSVPSPTKKAPNKSSAYRDSDISGPLAERKVFYRPLKPAVPVRINGSAPFNMEFRFFVSAQGEVGEVVPVISSGNVEVDLLGIRYLKGWKFTPVAANKAEGEWGRIKIILTKE